MKYISAEYLKKKFFLKEEDIAYMPSIMTCKGCKYFKDNYCIHHKIAVGENNYCNISHKM